MQVRAASPDTLDTVGQLTPVFLHEITNTLNMAAQTGEQREKQAELQGQLCGVLQVGGHLLVCVQLRCTNLLLCLHLGLLLL